MKILTTTNISKPDFYTWYGKMKKLTFILLFFMLSAGLRAQVEPVQSAYTYNMAYINPANTGISGMGSFFLWHRSQWYNMEGTPQTEMLSFEYPFKKVAFGLNAFYDKEGPVGRWNATALFSYVIELSLEISLSFGINLGADQFTYDPSSLNIKDAGESFLENNQTYTRIFSGVGATVYSEKWFLGISSPNVLPIRTVASDELHAVYHNPRVHFSGGINIPVAYQITMRPAFLLRYAGDLPLNFDTSLLFSFYDKFNLGFTYRYKAAYILLLSTKITKRFLIGYSFDMDATDLRRYNYGSHEVFLKYEFPTPTGKVRFQSPRFF